MRILFTLLGVMLTANGALGARTRLRPGAPDYALRGGRRH